MRKRYTTPIVEFEAILDDDAILASSGDSPVVESTMAEWAVGNGGEGSIDNRDEGLFIGYGDALAKGFSGFGDTWL